MPSRACVRWSPQSTPATGSPCSSSWEPISEPSLKRVGHSPATLPVILSNTRRVAREHVRLRWKEEIDAGASPKGQNLQGPEKVEGPRVHREGRIREGLPEEHREARQVLGQGRQAHRL